MPRILAFTNGADDWRALLADPGKHWKTGYSARALAHCWEAADGFPKEVRVALGSSSEPLLAGLDPLLAIPEFKVPLPGGVRPSQNDIFVLARSRAGPVTIMVEGKVNESFGPTLDGWRAGASEGKDERWRYLKKTLGLKREPAGSLRYQLFHRAASALITAEQFRARAGIMLVHSFSPENEWWDDYAAFTGLFSVEAVMGQVQRLGTASAIPLFGVWASGDRAFLNR